MACWNRRNVFLDGKWTSFGLFDEFKGYNEGRFLVVGSFWGKRTPQSRHCRNPCRHTCKICPVRRPLCWLGLGDTGRPRRSQERMYCFGGTTDWPCPATWTAAPHSPAQTWGRSSWFVGDIPAHRARNWPAKSWVRIMTNQWCFLSNLKLISSKS